jgi:hypothetical protein
MQNIAIQLHTILDTIDTLVGGWVLNEEVRTNAVNVCCESKWREKTSQSSLGGRNAGVDEAGDGVSTMTPTKLASKTAASLVVLTER